MKKIILLIGALFISTEALAGTQGLGKEFEQWDNPSNANAPTIILNYDDPEIESGNTMQFSMSGSTDLDGDSLFYFWRISDGSYMAWPTHYRYMTWRAPVVGSQKIVYVTGYVGDNEGHVTSRTVAIRVVPAGAGCPTLAGVRIDEVRTWGDGYFIRWDELSGEDHYILQEDTNASFSSPREIQLPRNSQWDLIEQDTNDTYYLRMKGVNECGDGAWGPTWTFVQNINHYPAAPQATSPADGATNVSLNPTLCWTTGHPDGDPVTYALYLRKGTGDSFLQSNRIYEGPNNCFSPNTLDWGQPYYWRVYAVDDDGSEVMGPISRFTSIADTNDPVGSITINSGAATTDSFIVNLSLTASDADSGIDRIWISNDGQAWSLHAFDEVIVWDLRDPSYGGSIQQNNIYTVYYKIEDETDNVSQVYTDTITKVDGAPGVLSLNGKTYESLKHAIEQAQAGDTIYMSPGVWEIGETESLNLPGSSVIGHLKLKAGVHLVGSGWDKTIIRSTQDWIGMAMHPGSSIAGLTYDSNGGRQAVIALGNNLIQHCRLTGADNNPALAVQHPDLDLITVRNSIFDNSDYGLWVSANPGTSPIKIYNSVFYNNRKGIWMSRAAPGTEVINSAMIHSLWCNVDITETERPNVNFIYNNMYDESDPETWCYRPYGMSGNINVNPYFVNAPTADYKLQASSGMINAGTGTIGLPFVGTDPDIGAYEYGATGTINVNAGHADASFAISGEAYYNGSGSSWSTTSAPPGMYTISYFPVENFNMPPPQTVFMEPGGTLDFDVQYIPDNEGPTGTMAVDFGAYSTRDEVVRMRLDVEDLTAGIDSSSQMQFSNDGVIWSTPEAFDPIVRWWDLTQYGGETGSGEKTVYAKVSDKLGNWSDPITDTIQYLPGQAELIVPDIYPTIDDALAVATAGDIIWLMPGDHSGSGTYNIPAGVRLQGSGSDVTSLSGKVVLAGDAQVDGLAIINSYISVNLTGPRSIISNMLLRGSRGVEVGGTIGETSYIRNNLFNYQSTIGNHGILVFADDSDVVIENNVFTNYGEAIYSDYQHTPVHLRNNIFYDLDYLICNQDPGADFYTKVFFERNAEWLVDDLYEVTGPGEMDRGVSRTQVLTGDPLFEDPASMDYRLQGSSPFINAGLDDPIYQNHDATDNTLGIEGSVTYNSRPHADFIINDAGSTTRLDSSISYDAQDDADGLRVRWDTDGDGVIDTPWEALGERTINLPRGTHDIQMQVRDRGYFVDTITKTVVVPNRLPDDPSGPTPGDYSMDASVNATLTWTSGDSDGDDVTYDIYFGEAGTTLQLVASDLVNATWDTPLLQYETLYEWRVVATDSEAGETEGSIWTFMTMAEPDTDGDGYIDSQDAFPNDITEWLDTDGDGTGDNADTDDDGDGYSDNDEIANGTNPLSAASTPTDTDGDFISDLNDPDDDNDGVPDGQDAFPTDATESVDTDGDGIGNNADPDDDNDGYSDADEIANGSDPTGGSSTPPDHDGDMIVDSVDTDDDNDGILDVDDAFDLDAGEWSDIDHDGIGDNADEDTVVEGFEDGDLGEDWDIADGVFDINGVASHYQSMGFEVDSSRVDSTSIGQLFDEPLDEFTMSGWFNIDELDQISIMVANGDELLDIVDILPTQVTQGETTVGHSITLDDWVQIEVSWDIAAETFTLSIDGNQIMQTSISFTEDQDLGSSVDLGQYITGFAITFGQASAVYLDDISFHMNKLSISVPPDEEGTGTTDELPGTGDPVPDGSGDVAADGDASAASPAAGGCNIMSGTERSPIVTVIALVAIAGLLILRRRYRKRT